MTDNESEDDTTDGTDSDRLESMMNLLDDYDEKWARTDAGQYEITLPDGKTVTARTRDDVRALLFEHYD